MKEQSFESFSKNLHRTNQRKPLYGQIELTYNCRYSCRHCYCKNQPRNDLGAGFWKKILDQLKSQGCFEITFTGGDPLLHKEFLSIYDYAIKNGFLVTIFTSGYPLTDELISFLSDQPPVSIEITVNSLNKLTYEKITGFKGGFDKTFSNIYKLKERGLPLILKCNGLRQNKNEIYQIKKFAEELLGKGKFKYDSFIFPGLNGEKAPLDCRLKPEEIKEIEQNDEDMLRQRRDQLKLKG
ncbi:MAG: radical SAM protein, partial [Candidatus Omnitrophica bacterium]|nr:radical SAM protein [Candidatus Omnitrophota bacterium]